MKQLSLVIGIPSFQEAEGIARITKAIDLALIADGFKPQEVMIVNSDNSSTDETQDIFLSTNTTNPKDLLITKNRGKGYNFIALFKYLLMHNAKCLITIDADLKKIYPGWLRKFYDAVALSKNSMVFPNYFRSWFDGNMTNQIVCPLVAAHTGIAIRQPIGGEFAFSPEFIAILLEQEWDKWSCGFGVDIFCTLTALRLSEKIEEINLPGGKFHHQRSFSESDLEEEFDMKFDAVVGTLLKTLKSFKKPLKSHTLKWTYMPRSQNKMIEFDYSYINYAAAKAKIHFTKNRLNSIFSLAISTFESIEREQWVDILDKLVHNSFLSDKIISELLPDFRKLFYIRMSTVLPYYNDDNTEEDILNLSKRLFKRLN